MIRFGAAVLAFACFTAWIALLCSCGGGSGPAHSGSRIISDSGRSLGSSDTRSLALGDLDGDDDPDQAVGYHALPVRSNSVGHGPVIDPGHHCDTPIWVVRKSQVQYVVLVGPPAFRIGLVCRSLAVLAS